MGLIEAALALREEVEALSFAPPVAYVYDPSWALHAEAALGLQGEFESWPVQSGWWLERRRRSMVRSA